MGFIVADEEFQRGATRIQSISDELCTIFDEVNTTIQNVTDDGINDILIHNELMALITKVDSFSTAVQEIASSVTSDTTCFISDVDTADSYLY